MASSLRVVTSKALSAFYTGAAAVSRVGGPDCGPGTYGITRENGVESTQCDRVYYLGGATVATSTTNRYDCAGSLLQPDGTAFLPARLDYIWVKNTGTVPLGIGPHATAGCGALVFAKANGDYVICHPGKTVILEAGINGAVVTATTADIIAVDNPSASVVGAYDFGMVGRST